MRARPALARALALVASLLLTAGVGRAQGDVPALMQAAAGGDRAALATLEGRARRGGLAEQLVLARLSIDGVGVARDVRAGYGWLCLAAHHDEVSASSVRAAWLVAEWFRTGGGLADRGYRGASRDREDPVRAYFWYGVLRMMGARDAEGGAQAARLAALGQRSVSRSLFESERTRMDAAAEAWEPWTPPADGELCLALPPGAGPGPAP